MWKTGHRLYSAALRLLGSPRLYGSAKRSGTARHGTARLCTALRCPTARFSAARLFGAALLGCSVLLFGCVNDDAPFDKPNKATVQLSVGSTLAGSTTGELSEAEGKLYTLRVYAFSGGRPAGHYFTDQVTMQEGKHTFYMDLTTYSAGDQTVDFYVVANEQAMSLKRTPESSGQDLNITLSETTPEAELTNAWFNNYIAPNLETRGLPMCCKRSQTLNFNNLSAETAPAGSGHEGHPLLNTKIEFALERPMAKIGVFAAKPAGESGKLQVTKIEIPARGVNVRNYLMAQSDETLKAILSGGRDVDIPVVRDETGNAAEVTAEIAETADRTNPANYTPVMAEPYYPFENAFSNGGSWDIEGADMKGFAFRIEYNFNGGQTRSREVFLPRIERNHYYAVCCLIHNDGRIVITYNVADWTAADVYEMNLEYPSYDNPIVPLNQLLPPEGSDQYSQPTIWYDPTGSDESANVTFIFNIRGPVNLPWQPVLDYNGATKQDYKVEVYQLDAAGNKIMKTDFDHTTEETNDDCVADPDRPYYITVKATGSKVNHQVGLGISYSRRWNPEFGSSLLLINGRTGYLRYENSQYAEYVVIKQVDVPTEQAN